MPYKLLTAPLKLFAPLKRVAYSLLFASGIGVAVLFVALSLLVDVKSLSVLLAAIGAALGALIVGLSFPKLLVAAGSQRERQLERDIDAAVRQRTQLLAEIDRLKSQQLQVSQVQSVLKLTLLELETTLTDFSKQDLGSQERTLGGREMHTYVGVLRRKVKLMLGIDLAKLRVRSEADTLVIDGLRAEFQGVRDDQQEWLMRHIQVDQDNVLMSNKTLVLQDDVRLLHASSQQQDELEQRLRQGVELRGLESVLEDMGAKWLQAMLAPIGVEIRFGPLMPEEGSSFVDYLGTRNRELQQRRLQLEQAVSATPILPDPGAHLGPDSDIRDNSSSPN